LPAAKRSPRVNLTKLMTNSLPAEPAAGHYSALFHIASERPKFAAGLDRNQGAARNPAVG
jgi:hypothetical protein